MANLAKQKRIAADVMKVGKGRVWIDPEATEDITEAITKEDIRGLIEEGIIKKKQKKGVSRGRARERAMKKAQGRRKGHGSRKGAKGARRGKKRLWITKIRGLRRRLKELRDAEQIDRTTYRKLYNKAKAGEIRNIAHLNEFIKSSGLMKEG
ncbi:MAG: 50S ribosomal protein L19e [Methanophagales archaeon]|nr:50S ribosomal protein L19e [Methanophagales archaeon]MCW3141304.1 50S ribosomal protein L19e [Methanophagales archaeon]